MIDEKAFRDLVTRKTIELVKELDGRTEVVVAQLSIALFRYFVIELKWIPKSQDLDTLCDLLLGGMQEAFRSIDELAKEIARKKIIIPNSHH